MAQRFCEREQCGNEFTTPRRSDARYCSDRCRKAAERERAQTATVEDDDLVADHRQEFGRLEVSTFLELQRANALHSSAGQRALMAARRLDDATTLRESGQSIAALMRAHQDAVNVALGNAVPANEDEVDAARRRRAERRASTTRDH